MRRVILDTGAVAPPAGATSLLVERFLDYVRHERGLAVNTQAAYRRDLRDFTAWLGGRAVAAIDVRGRLLSSPSPAAEKRDS